MTSINQQGDDNAFVVITAFPTPAPEINIGYGDIADLSFGAIKVPLGQSCTNEIADGFETGIDCGGGCKGCGIGDKCIDDADCYLYICEENICVAERSGSGSGSGSGVAAGDGVAAGAGVAAVKAACSTVNGMAVAPDTWCWVGDWTKLILPLILAASITTCCFCMCAKEAREKRKTIIGTPAAATAEDEFYSTFSIDVPPGAVGVLFESLPDFDSALGVSTAVVADFAADCPFRDKVPIGSCLVSIDSYEGRGEHNHRKISTIGMMLGEIQAVIVSTAQYDRTFTFHGKAGADAHYASLLKTGKQAPVTPRVSVANHLNFDAEAGSGPTDSSECVLMSPLESLV
jgi:hypothetical protein